MSRNGWIAVAGLGSLALLAGAFGFQYLGGLAPCKMCLWQRWPHVAAVLVALFALAFGQWSKGSLMPALGALAALVSAGLGAYHTGVERGWWQGPSSCSGGAGGDLLRMDGPLDMVMCDTVAWQMLGLSMAGWNMLASLGLAAIWVMAARRAA
ncbi:MAG: disulfide bond formation protein B [Rhodobacterales bacterium]|nr:disulfide bond formation protein B [Rhodobacterales bacterium]